MVTFAAEASRLHPAWPSSPPRLSDQAPAQLPAPPIGKAASTAVVRRGGKTQPPRKVEPARPALRPPVKSVQEVREAMMCDLHMAWCGCSHLHVHHHNCDMLLAERSVTGCINNYL